MNNLFETVKAVFRIWTDEGNLDWKIFVTKMQFNAWWTGLHIDAGFIVGSVIITLFIAMVAYTAYDHHKTPKAA